MKKIFLILGMTFLLFGCVTYYLTDENVNPWLISKEGTPSINITGIWDSGNMMSGGWGGAQLIQSGNKISGTLGLYSVKGVINGTSIYLSLYTNMRIYHTAILNMVDKGKMEGKVIEGTIADGESAKNATTYLSLFNNSVSGPGFSFRS